MVTIGIAMFANAAWFGEALAEREWVPAVIHAFVWVTGVFVGSVLRPRRERGKRTENQANNPVPRPNHQRVRSTSMAQR